MEFKVSSGPCVSCNGWATFSAGMLHLHLSENSWQWPKIQWLIVYVVMNMW